MFGSNLFAVKKLHQSLRWEAREVTWQNSLRSSARSLAPKSCSGPLCGPLSDPPVSEYVGNLGSNPDSPVRPLRAEGILLAVLAGTQARGTSEQFAEGTGVGVAADVSNGLHAVNANL